MRRYWTVRGLRGRVSLITEARAAWLLLALCISCFAAVLVSTGIGSVYVNPWHVLQALFGFGDDANQLIVKQFRLPRILVSLMVGAALAVSGSILQGMIRNPLASPDIIGVTGGASVAAVGLIVLYPSASVHMLPAFAMIGAFVVTFLIYLLAWKNGVASLRLVLIGVGIGSGMTALTTLLIVISPMHLTEKAFIWLTGSVYGSNWRHVWSMLPWIAAFLPLAWIGARHLNSLQLGEDVAKSVGTRVQLHRLGLLLVCVALAGSAVGIAGAIGFVGLIAPHIARKLVGSSYGSLVPASALIGGLLVLVSDTIARSAFSPLDIPVGVFTAAIGAPFFIFLLYKNRNA